MRKLQLPLLPLSQFVAIIDEKMSGNFLPILHPLLANAICPIEKISARGFAMLDHYHNSCVEFLLRMFRVRQARSLRGNHVLDRDFCFLRFEYWVAVVIIASWHEILSR